MKIKQLVSFFLCLLILFCLSGNAAFAKNAAAASFSPDYYRLPCGSAIFSDRSLTDKIGTLSEDAVVYAVSCKKCSRAFRLAAIVTSFQIIAKSVPADKQPCCTHSSVEFTA